MAVILGEMMTTAEDHSVPDAQLAPSSGPGGSAEPAKSPRWMRIAVCCGGVLVGIPFLTVLGLIAYVLIKHFSG